MANLLSFVVVAGAIVGGPLIWLLSRSRSQPGTRQMVLLGGAAGEAELSVWVAALRSAGISAGAERGRFPLVWQYTSLVRDLGAGGRRGPGRKVLGL